MGDARFRQTGRRTRVGPFRKDLKDIRRKDGEVRNAAWQALSDADKRNIIEERPGRSLRQRKKLGMSQ